MHTEKIEKLLARQRAIKDAIKQETRQAKARKQKALFAAVKRAGLLDLSGDQIETVLRNYKQKFAKNDSEDGTQS